GLESPTYFLAGVISPIRRSGGADACDRLLSGGEMPTLLDNLETRSEECWNRPGATDAAERLRTTMAACRVQVTCWGVQQALTPEQNAQPPRPSVREPVPLRRQATAGH